MERLGPEPGSVLGRQLLELEPEHLGQRGDGVRPYLVHGHRPSELARDGRERRVLQPARGDPVGERRRVEVDVECVAVGRDPAGDVDADRRDLPWRTRQPEPGQSLERLASQPERLDRLRQRLLEVPDVALHVAAVSLQVEDRVADELPGRVIRGLAAAIRLDDVDGSALREMQLGRLVGAPPERDHRRVLEHDDRVRDRTLRDRAGERALQLPRLEIRNLAELHHVPASRHGVRVLVVSRL